MANFSIISQMVQEEMHLLCKKNESVYLLAQMMVANLSENFRKMQVS